MDFVSKGWRRVHACVHALIFNNTSHTAPIHRADGRSPAPSTGALNLGPRMKWMYGLPWLLLLMAGWVHAQNFNAVSTYPNNKVQWDGPTAQAWEESSLAAAWKSYFSSVGSPEQCWLMDWHVWPSGTTYNPPLHTTEMEADAHCIIPPNPTVLVYQPYAYYSVYTCDQGYRWGQLPSTPGTLGCYTGYYVSPTDHNASGGDCSCNGKKGRPATPYPIEIGTGNMSESATDFVSGDGRLRLDRYYNSNAATQSASGIGWKNAFVARHIGRIEDGLPDASISTTAPSTASVLYGSAADACTQGVANLAATYPSYAGMTASFSGGQCTLSNGVVQPIFHTDSTQGYVSPVQDAVAGVTVFRPDGSSYFFTCSHGTCQPIHQSEITLSVSSSGYTLTAENGDVESYDLNGNLLKIVSRDGYTQTVASTTNTTANTTTINTVTDSYGHVLSFAYDTYGRLSQVTLPDQSVVQYGYDTLSRLTSVTYPDKSIVSYQYTNPNFPQAMTAWVDESNTTYATWTYDNTSGNALTSALAGNVDTSTLSYGTNATTLTDNLGTQRTYNYQDIAGTPRLTSVSGPVCKDCMGQSMTYDSNGFLKSALDWNGRTSGYTYGATGLLQQRIDGAGTTVQRTTNFSWNAGLRVPLTSTVLDANGNTVSNTQWVYNGSGQTLARCEIDPASSAASGYACSNTGAVPAGVRRWTYTYCTAVDATECPIVGLMLTATGPRTDATQTTTYSYYLASSATNCGTPGAACYQAGELHTVTDPQGHLTTIASYDADGRITRVTDANGINTDMTYTPRGWLASRSVASATTSFTYTPYGAVRTVTDPDGVITTYGYDSAHRLMKITDAQSDYVQYTLDAAGNKTAEQVYDSTGTLHKNLSRTFNTLGQLTKVIDGLNHTIFDASASNSYDANGNLVQSADGFSIQRKLSYDALNRLVQTLDNYNGTN